MTAPAIELHRQKMTPIDMGQVTCIILGGGQGSRLFPLTSTRCKPAVTFGGRYRLIDVPISNTINSGCYKIFVVTQFLSTSVHRHIARTYKMDSYSQGFIDILAAEQKPAQTAWFQGTADAVRQNLEYFLDTPGEYFLILSGDQLYNLDFRKMVHFARECDADVVIASKLIGREDAGRMGVLKVDGNYAVKSFEEKPQDKDILNDLALGDGNFLGSMGIYLFKRKALLELLHEDPRNDFGKHLIPTQMRKGGLHAFVFDGYWEDIGTIGSFYKANIALTETITPFNCHDEANPIYAEPYNLPGPKIFGTFIDQSIICEGGIIEAGAISGSVLGPRTVIREGAVIRDSYVMGNDYYEAPVQSSPNFPEKLEIGAGSLIERAIIDKHAYIGKNVRLVNEQNLRHYDGDEFFVRDGIIITKRGAFLPDNFTF